VRSHHELCATCGYMLPQCKCVGLSRQETREPLGPICTRCKGIGHAWFDCPERPTRSVEDLKAWCVELPPLDTSAPPRMPRRLVTAPLAGAAYAKRLQTGKRPLTHAVELDADGVPMRVLCGKVRLSSVLDDATQYGVHPLDCDACIRRFGEDS
jgi:hypothetical protein